MQTPDILFVRVRYARYTRGEPLVLDADAFDLRWDDAAQNSVWVAGPHPAFPNPTYP